MTIFIINNIKAIKDSVETKNKILEEKSVLDNIEKISEEIIKAFKQDKKVLELLGNINKKIIT